MGGKATGRFVSPTEVVATEWGGIVGTVAATTINWANGTAWTFRPVPTGLPDLGGRLATQG
ncbi:MAG: hypothetical protein ACKV0T_28040 [Planctomycetales bacterium]